MMARKIRPAYVLVPLWGALILVSWFLLGRRESRKTDEWTATRPMAANFQLREDSLIGPEERYRLAKMTKKNLLVGRHLRKAKNPGDMIRLEDTISQPEFEICGHNSGVLLYGLKGEERLADGVDVGSWIIPCYTRKQASGKAPYLTKCTRISLIVESVHRPTSTADSTWIALRIPSCVLQEIGEFLASERRFLLVSANPPLVKEQVCRR